MARNHTPATCFGRVIDGKEAAAEAVDPASERYVEAMRARRDWPWEAQGRGLRLGVERYRCNLPILALEPSAIERDLDGVQYDAVGWLADLDVDNFRAGESRVVEIRP